MLAKSSSTPCLLSLLRTEDKSQISKVLSKQADFLSLPPPSMASLSPSSKSHSLRARTRIRTYGDQHSVSTPKKRVSISPRCLVPAAAQLSSPKSLPRAQSEPDLQLISYLSPRQPGAGPSTARASSRGGCSLVEHHSISASSPVGASGPGFGFRSAHPRSRAQTLRTHSLSLAHPPTRLDVPSDIQACLSSVTYRGHRDEGSFFQAEFQPHTYFSPRPDPVFSSSEGDSASPNRACQSTFRNFLSMNSARAALCPPEATRICLERSERSTFTVEQRTEVGDGGGEGGGAGGRGVRGFGGKGSGGDNEPSDSGFESMSSDDTDAYYRRALADSPVNPLLLRNYARYLFEVCKDYERACEFYERAILENPSDGEVLAQYAKLLWEGIKDSDRAAIYFERAVHVAPEDCYVLAAHASFLWGVEHDSSELEGVSHGPELPALAARNHSC